MLFTRSDSGESHSAPGGNGGAVIGIAIVCICVIGVFAKKAYDRHQEELRLQAIETKNSEIDGEYQRFEKEEDRNKKLEALKQLMRENCSEKERI